MYELTVDGADTFEEVARPRRAVQSLAEGGGGNIW